MNPINERVRKYRKLLHIRQTDIAKALGMKGSSYSQKERTGNFSGECLKEIADYFNIDILILLYGEEVIRKEPQPLPKPEPEPKPAKKNGYTIENLTKQQYDFWNYFLATSKPRQILIYKYSYELFKGKNLKNFDGL